MASRFGTSGVFGLDEVPGSPLPKQEQHRVAGLKFIGFRQQQEGYRS